MIQRIKNNAFARNSLILFVGTMLASAINYFFHLVVGRMVSVQIYGEVESIISLVAIISVPAAALTMVVTKYSAGTKAENNTAESHKLISYFNGKIFKYGLPIFILALVISPFLKSFLKIGSNVPLILVWIMMFVSFFSAITSGVLNGWQKFKDISWTGILGAIAKLVAAVVFIKLGFDVSGIVGGFALGAIVTYILSLYVLRFIFRTKAEKNENSGKIDFVSVKRYVMPAFIGNLAMNILGNADMVMAKHNLDPILAGQYGALTITSKIIFFATGVISTVLFSMASENNHKNDNSGRILRQAFYLMALFSFVSMLIYFMFPKFVLGMLFGGKYSDVAHLLGWFSILVVLFSFANLFLQYFLSIHKTKIVYSFLAVAIFEVLAILFVGKTISVILTVVIISQALAVAASLFYLLKLNLKKNNEF